MACEAGSGFGAMPFGSGPFGTGAPPLALGAAEVVSANEVCIEYEGELGAGCGCESGDSALSPMAWIVEALNPPTALPPFVQWVEESDGRLCLYLDRPLCCDVVYRITLVSVFEDPCNSKIVMGPCVPESAQSLPLQSGDGFLRDIANPFLERDATQTGTLLALGTYEITDQGDIAQDAGVSSLRKRVFRRVTTLFSEFFHLPNYGTEMEVKRLLRPDLVRRYQDKLKVQIEREPEVSACAVRVSQVAGSPEVVSVYVRVQTASGQSIDLAVPITLP